jgi:hypothetical protein
MEFFSPYTDMQNYAVGLLYDIFRHLYKIDSLHIDYAI